jgi:aspartate kinase
MFGKTQIGGVKSERGLTMIGVLTMKSRPGTAGRIMSALGAHNLNIEFIAQTIDLAENDSIVFCVKAEQADEAMAVLQNLKPELKAETISRRDHVGLVFTFGPEFRHMPGVAGKIFDLLGQADINIIAISTSMAAVTCVLEDDCVARAEAVLKTAFETP